MINNRILLYLYFLLIPCVVFGQEKYPRDYFRSPLDIPLYLSGNFGEIRSNHFHAGLDIKTMGVEGKNTYAVGDGYVSRIKVSTSGYGKTLYITHPNGYTSVYAHLQRFSDKIEAYVKKAQYQKESFEIELFPGSGSLPVTKGELIALTGNTGGSGGPHLHFEIRETKSEVPVNPLLFGFDLTDDIKPILKTLVVYPLNERSWVNGSNRPRHINIHGSNGNYRINSTVEVQGDIGFGIEVIDKTNGSSNRCGVYSVQLFMDDEEVYGHQMERIGFYETRYINSHIDYYESSKNHKRIQKCFLQPNNHLGIYGNLKNRGWLSFNQDTVHPVKYLIKDAHENTSVLEFSVQSNKVKALAKEPDNKNSLATIFRHNEYNSFENNNVVLSVPAQVLYEDIVFDYQETPAIKGALTPTHHLHHPYVPLHSYMTASLRTGPLQEEYRDKAVVVALTENEHILASEGGKWVDGFITFKSRSLGPYTVMLDTVPPKIKPYNIYANKDMSRNESIRVKIYDNLSGIKSYRGTIDGKWILMEYEYKQNLLTYYFDDRAGEGEHVFELTVTDERGNSSSYKAPFKR